MSDLHLLYLPDVLFRATFILYLQETDFPLATWGKGSTITEALTACNK